MTLELTDATLIIQQEGIAAIRTTPFIAIILLHCFAAVSFAAEAPLAKPEATRAFRTEVVAFEDNFLYATPAEGNLIYRVEGNGGLKRVATGRDRGFVFTGGEVGCVHPAQYDRPTLRLRLTVTSGEPGIAICHNGMRSNSGERNPSPGLEIVLRERDTAVRDLATGKIVSIIPAAFPRGRESTLSIAWDFDARKVRVELPQGAYGLAMPSSVKEKGGFGLRSPSAPATSSRVSKIQVVWQDEREVLLYDGYDTVYGLDGKLLGRIPPVTLPDGLTKYETTAVDPRRERSLLVLGADDLSYEYHNTIRGWAVRDLKTGKLDVLSRESRLNGCLPLQGSGGMDGYWLLQSWRPPASCCWLDWNAYDRGDIQRFAVPFKTAVVDGQKFTGFHDPGNALDGSIARYLHITESWRGVNHLTVHPNLAPYAPFADVAFPPPTHPNVSHTASGGMPVQLAIRDRERAWYEQWAYPANGLHVQNRGYNLFTRTDDWSGPLYPTEKNARPYTDFANLAQSLTDPGRMIGSLYRFSATETDAKRIECLGTYWLRAGKDGLIVGKAISTKPWPTPFQMLFSRKNLH